jgi:hypothetical protein
LDGRRAQQDSLVLAGRLIDKGVPMKTSSGSRRITRGDVEAVLHAFGGGGRAVLLHSKTAEGAPADFAGSHGSIRPFAGSPWDGAHFCADDWHVIVIADFEGGDASFQHDDAARIMDGLEVSFTLDGAALPATRTAIKRFLNPEQFGLEVAYYFQQGQIMAPADLSIGSHRLEVTVIDASGQQDFHDGITFFIDPPGTGACG